MLGEDVEDQRLAVHDVTSEQLLQVALLGRCERVVEDHYVDVECCGQTCQLSGFSGAYVGGRVDPMSADHLLVDRLRARGVRQEGELLNASLHLRCGRLRSLNADQKGSLDPHFEVGDRCGESAAPTGSVLLCHAGIIRVSGDVASLPGLMRAMDGFSEVLALVANVFLLLFGNDL